MRASSTLTVATWNINSVRLRQGLLERFVLEHEPDIVCLQETKCQNGQFPAAPFRKLGYEHIALNGQKGYHGVATLSRLPLAQIQCRSFCGIGDSRHVECVVEIAGRRIRLHNFYVPAGGDEPDRDVNPKFAHKLDFLEEMRCVTTDAGTHDAALLVGDLNIAPLENDVWSHRQLLKVVSHTPVETETLEDLRRKAGWTDLMRTRIPPEEKLYTWWSYRARDWQASNRGRRLDHIWGTPNLVSPMSDLRVLTQARGWPKPSDHVPVIARFALGA
ncbi:MULTISPECIES: exodeoxyribonuclease III [unclassified Roseitalea]|uniref:exodeoxyribonuclease III n=1 Tax=unclassified Roseitalea TaxID=2639107 RepID=UPI00273E0E04|nr:MULTISPECIES: exodeoxyribonuclease III [unclassified Roseitalea]